MDIIDNIRLRQKNLLLSPRRSKLPEHRPKLLYIGCVDARLDPVKDIGIASGEALIFRNIGALVPKCDNKQAAAIQKFDFSSGEVPQDVSIGAVLEFFLNHIPAEEGEIKHIAVSGHTHCGGIKACQHGHFHAEDHYLPRYLKSLDPIRATVNAEAKEKGWNEEQILRALEEESVRKSITNLQTYPAVARAIADGKLQNHGWVIDTATQRISEMDPETLQFEPLVK